MPWDFATCNVIRNFRNLPSKPPGRLSLSNYKFTVASNAMGNRNKRWYTINTRSKCSESIPIAQYKFIRAINILKPYTMWWALLNVRNEYTKTNPISDRYNFGLIKSIVCYFSAGSVVERNLSLNLHIDWLDVQPFATNRLYKRSSAINRNYARGFILCCSITANSNSFSTPSRTSRLIRSATALCPCCWLLARRPTSTEKYCRSYIVSSQSASGNRVIFLLLLLLHPS